jgi:hypothetical protein
VTGTSSNATPGVSGTTFKLHTSGAAAGYSEDTGRATTYTVTFSEGVSGADATGGTFTGTTFTIHSGAVDSTARSGGKLTTVWVKVRPSSGPFGFFEPR